MKARCRHRRDSKATFFQCACNHRSHGGDANTRKPLTQFHFESGPPLMICRTLKYFEDILKEHRFLRIHRSHMINPDYVIRYSKGKGGSVTMKNDKELEISANKKEEFLKLFER